MKVLITGGAGFLGQRLARRLLDEGALPGSEGRTQPIDELTLLDVVPAPSAGDTRVRSVVGDIAERRVLEDAIDPDTCAIFHLAAIVSGQAEADFDLGMRINLDASRQLLEVCRARGHRPRVVFTSSVAVYGGALPEIVRDDTALDPRSSYGMQKAVAELLLADYTRRGFVDGRVLRLPTISVRPGRPNAAASSFASETAVLPVDPATRLWLLSPRAAIEALVHGYALDASLLGDRPIVNLPGLSVSAGQMIDALRAVAGDAAAARVVYRRDERIERIVGSWPGRWDTTRAESLGFIGDRDFVDVIRAYLADDAPRT
jgi:D-erythronate 2-dehydrogenase